MVKDPDKQVLIGTNAIDYDYLKTMKMELDIRKRFFKRFRVGYGKRYNRKFPCK